MKTLVALFLSCSVLGDVVFPRTAVDWGTQDTFCSGTNEFSLTFVTIDDPGNPPKVNGYGTVGSVGETFRISKYEMSELQARKLIDFCHLPVTYGEWGAERPVTRIHFGESVYMVNALNRLKGKRPAHRVMVNGRIGFWNVDESYTRDGVVNRLTHKDADYVIPDLDQQFKAAQWSKVEQAWKKYGQGSVSAPTAVNGFYGGSTAPNTSVVNQVHDCEYPEYSSPGNQIDVTIEVNGANQITAVNTPVFVGGHSGNVSTTTAYSVVQGSAVGGTVRVATYQTVRVPATFEIVNGGSGYQGFPNNECVWVSNVGYVTTYDCSVTLGADTMRCWMWSRDGVVLGIMPYTGRWTTEDTTTVVDIVQAGGVGATARCTRYVDVKMPATFGAIVGGSGYANGTARIKTGLQDFLEWQSTQPWRGTAPVTSAGGLSPFGVMALDGNCHEHCTTPVDFVYDMDLGGDDEEVFLFSSYWNIGPWSEGQPEDWTSINLWHGNSWESGLRVGSLVVP